MQKLLYFILSIALLAAYSCRSEREQRADSPSEKPMVLSQRDTLEIQGLVEQFMELAINREYAEAAAMLYEIDANDINQEPLLLDNEKMQNVKKALETFPIESYEINRISLKEATDNEVECTIHFFRTASSKWYFKPVRYLGNWRLCLRNTLSGDKSFSRIDL